MLFGPQKILPMTTIKHCEMSHHACSILFRSGIRVCISQSFDVEVKPNKKKMVDRYSCLCYFNPYYDCYFYHDKDVFVSVLDMVHE